MRPFLRDLTCSLRAPCAHARRPDVRSRRSRPGSRSRGEADAVRQPARRRGVAHAGDPGNARTIRKTLRNVDPSLALGGIRTLRQEYARSLADRRIRLIPAAGLAGLAIAVALVGLGGLLARAVAERRRELAIRTVLGASPRGAVGILREGLLLAAVGVILGLGAGAAAARSLRSLLYGVSPLDPLTFVGVAVFVTGAGLLTSFVAARRAAGVEPLELLRSE